MELIAIVASMVIGGLFGTATANVDSIVGDVMTIDLEVEVTPAVVGSVVAHMLFEDESDLTLPLLDRGDGVYGVRTELEPKNYFVVFEVIGEDGGMSEPVSLTELGADITVSSSPTTTSTGDAKEPASYQMLWLAVALGAGSLSALAFWVLGGREEKGDDDDLDEEDENYDSSATTEEE